MRISDWSSDVCSSDLARLAKSNAREFEALVASMLDAGIWQPLSNTRLKSGPTPRTVTFEPSPIERSIDTPLMRCSDSARLVSGNLRSEEHTSELQSLMRLSYDVFCSKKKNKIQPYH